MIEKLSNVLSAKFWPDSEQRQQEFKRQVHNYFDAKNQLKRKQNSQTALQNLKYDRNKIFTLLADHQQQEYKIILEFTLSDIYSTLEESIINRLDMDLQQEHFLADLLTIPMDNIHGYFHENNVPSEGYSNQILKNLLQKQSDGQFAIHALDQLKYHRWLCVKPNKTANETDKEAVNSALQRIYTYFEGTAERYFNGRTNELIQLLIEKQERNARVHFGRKCNAYYKTSKPSCDISSFLNQEEHILLKSSFEPGPIPNFEVQENVVHFNKMFKHYCMSKEEKW